MKILIVQNKKGIGDLIIFLPFIEALAKKFETQVYLLVKENSKALDIVEDNKYIKEIIVLDRDNKSNDGVHEGVFGTFRLIKKLKLSAEEILEKYLNKSYFCYMTGFVAGMPFLGDISKELRTDRLKTPRVKVPEGSVGITEQFSNIYTFESPGGWNIIGKTPYKIFNSNNKANPVLINPGDNVHFFPISKNEFLKLDEK